MFSNSHSPFITVLGCYTTDVVIDTIGLPWKQESEHLSELHTELLLLLFYFDPVMVNMNSMKRVIPLHFIWWKKDSKLCCDTTMPESIHTKDESKRGSAFAFIFGVNWPVQWMLRNDKFHWIHEYTIWYSLRPWESTQKDTLFVAHWACSSRTISWPSPPPPGTP